MHLTTESMTPCDNAGLQGPVYDTSGIQKLTIPKLDCGYGDLNCKNMKNMVEEIFRNYCAIILVCTFNA
ncbi:hypothetical protein J6590_018380 [Homalodisca vitripennis]|nr:hypothetical protein J6590_018380 [Homalodisca vitripennis]